MTHGYRPVDDQTARRLNDINRRFYATIADDFHATRGQAWRGWERLLPHLHAPLSVLDVGCGNGRFGVFLAEHDLTPLSYHGIDNSPALLDHARLQLAAQPQVTTRLDAADVIDEPLPDAQYDLVTLFGVMHHIPGAARRLHLMLRLAACVKPGGLLAFACWRFYEYPRFRERIVAWDADIVVEANDYLLDWRRGAHVLRYCHYVDDAEHAALVAASGLHEIETWRADGETNTVNRYSLLRQEA
ncbi:MAG: class I SAM-dependent methyltransferase [Chloroflexota bacterium]|nr:class I SAM-dependent methyltransferase [Chloroflexota bacterium]